jgi:YlmC/YmxH family sporulation protein
MVRMSDLRMRSVVNIHDGRRLGNVEDLEIDPERGQILALVVPSPTGFLGLFAREGDYVIPWERIHKIGQDVILVEVQNFAEPRRWDESDR